MSAATEDPPSIEEQYEVQISAKNLLMTETRHSADLVLGAGLVPPEHRFGMSLMRLRAEFAGVASSLRLGEAYARERDRQATAAAKVRSEKVDAAKALKAANEMRKQSAGELMALRLLTLSHIPSLPAVREELGARAITLATRGWTTSRGRRHFMKSDAVVCAIAGRVLDVYLDPVCAYCAGTKLSGSAYRGERAAACHPCGSSGSRTAGGEDDADREFAREVENLLREAVNGACTALEKTKRYTAP